MRLITKGGGYNWTDRYPWIVEAARKNRIKQFVIDGDDLRRLCASVNFTFAGACSGSTWKWLSATAMDLIFFSHTCGPAARDLNAPSARGEPTGRVDGMRLGDEAYRPWTRLKYRLQASYFASRIAKIIA